MSMGGSIYRLNALQPTHWRLLVPHIRDPKPDYIFHDLQILTEQIARILHIFLWVYSLS